MQCDSDRDQQNAREINTRRNLPQNDQSDQRFGSHDFSPPRPAADPWPAAAVAAGDDGPPGHGGGADRSMAGRDYFVYCPFCAR